jgi:DeoR/GlpR family transcriptional regulator of sugar metabolism
LLIHDQLKRRPLASIAALAATTSLTPTTIASSLGKLRSLGIVREVTGGTYGRLYAYDGYLAILSEGSEAIH